MNLPDERSFNRWFIIFSCLVVITLVLWNTSIFFQRLKEDERARMNIWAEAYQGIDSASDDAHLDLILEILNNNTTIPIIYVNEEGDIADTANIETEITDDAEKLEDYRLELMDENEPITVDLGEGQVQYIYYGNSPALNKLKYYPIGLTLIGFLFVGVVYFFYTTTKNSEQNKLWAGMAKETAHQIGTPLSSLIGWTEILKTEEVNPSFVLEMEKDIDRLRTITERFSKIGSSPNLQQTDVVYATKETFEYLKNRSSTLIDFNIKTPRQPIYVMLNEQLYSWTIENLVKNAIDAMRGKGKLQIEIKQDLKQAHIYITDSGKGIEKNRFRTIFDPGQTTKKRGWGLGLSLAKRIVEEYHNGKIKVARSEINKGTTFQISLKKI